MPGQLADVLEGKHKGETVAIVDVGTHGWAVCELPMKDDESGDIIGLEVKHLRPWQSVKKIQFHRDGTRTYTDMEGVVHGPGYRDEV